MKPSIAVERRRWLNSALAEIVQSSPPILTFLQDPRYLERFDAGVTRYKKQIDDIWSVWHATHGILMDDLSQSRSMQFMRYVIVWLLRLVRTACSPSHYARREH